MVRESTTMFGIGTNKANLKGEISQSKNPMGQDENSWGLNTVGFLWHGGCYSAFLHDEDHEGLLNSDDIFGIDRIFSNYTIGIYFDGIAGTLTYFVDGVCLGVAFEGTVVKDIKTNIKNIITNDFI